jgi:hypothetical protein
MHKYVPTALAIALNITMLVLAVSASLTPANAITGGGRRPCFLSEYSSRTALDDASCACRSQCKGYGRPSPDIAACVAKCAAAKKAAQH